MDPNQQPNPAPTPNPYPPQNPQPSAQQPSIPVAPQGIPATPPQAPMPAPQLPTAYSTQPQTAYDPNYLDSIAPAPAAPKFFSGSFGKIFFVLIALFFLAVSIIVATGGKDETADLQSVAVRLDNLSKTTKKAHVNFRSASLSTTNSNYMLWIADSKRQAEELLSLGGIQKSDYNKVMMGEEKTLMTELDAKYEDARLNVKLERIYAASMAAETEKLINLYSTMARKNKSDKIRDYATNANKNLEPLHKAFSEFNEDDDTVATPSTDAAKS